MMDVDVFPNLHGLQLSSSLSGGEPDFSELHSLECAELHNVNVFTQTKNLVKILPQKRVNHDWFVFATKCVKSWFVCSYFNLKDHMFLLAPNIYTDLHSIWVRWAYPNEMGCFQKLVCNSQRDLQIFYTFFVFGLNVSGIKLPQWNGPFSKSFTQCQKRVCHFPKFYPRPLTQIMAQ